MKFIEAIRQQHQRNLLLFRHNKEGIHRYNSANLPYTIIVAAALLILTAIFSIFRQTVLETLPLYVTAIVMLIIIFFLSRQKKLKKYVMLWAYLMGFVMMSFAIYLSIVQFSNRPAGILLTLFVIVPLLFIDYTFRINLFTFFFFVLHSILTYLFKSPDLASLDLLNTSISFLLGTLFCYLFAKSRLEALEMRRQLTIERETDFLTGLFNRRKLYEKYDDLVKHDLYPIGFLIIDIDHFKEYNDEFGHVAGDQCLVQFSTFILQYEKSHPIQFYRYGGEEFVALTWGLKQEEVLELAEDIRKSIEISQLFLIKVTISVGVAIFDGQCTSSLEKLINHADKALYHVKNTGRNKTELYHNQQNH